METIITYRCEICGHQSANSSEIKKCEAQGFSPRLEIGQIVYHNFTGHPKFKEDFVLVKILGVNCKRQTHEPVYSVEYQVDGGGLKKGDVVAVGEGMLFRLRKKVFNPVNKTALTTATKKRQAALDYTKKVLKTSS